MARRLLTPSIAVGLLLGFAVTGLAVQENRSPNDCTLGPSALKRVAISGGSFELHVPKTVSRTSTLPLLVSLHGTGANGTVQSKVAEWVTFDDQQTKLGAPFIEIFPQNGVTWSWDSDTNASVKLVFKAMQNVVSSHCIRTDLIYVEGWSAGGYLAQRMACADSDPKVNDHGLDIAAISAYASGDPQSRTSAPCGLAGKPKRVIPVLMTQGLQDILVHPKRMGFVGFTAWAKRYGCGAPSAAFTVAQHLLACSGGTKVAWLPIPGFGHTRWSCANDPTWHNTVIWSFLRNGVIPTTTCSPPGPIGT